MAVTSWSWVSSLLWEIHFCYLSHLVYGTLLQQPEPTKTICSTTCQIQLGCFLRLSSIKNYYIHPRSQHFLYIGKTNLKLLFRVPLKEKNQGRCAIEDFVLVLGKETDIRRRYFPSVHFPTITWRGGTLLCHSGSHREIKLNWGRLNKALFIHLYAVH